MKQVDVTTKQPSLPLWQALSQQQLVSGEAPEGAEVNSPWFVKLLLAVAGWLAASFFLGFMALGFEFIIESDAGPYVVGIILMLLAWLLLVKSHNEFAEHLALALSFSGQVLWIFGVAQHFDTNLTWLLAAILQLVLVGIMPNDIHRFCSAWLFAGCLMAALALFQLPFIAGGLLFGLACWLLLNEFKPLKSAGVASVFYRHQAIAYGLLISQLMQSCFMAYQYSWYQLMSDTADKDFYTAPWMGNILLALVSVYVANKILSFYLELSQKLRYGVWLAMVIISVLSFEAPGINVALIVVLLGFAASNYLLMGLGIAALLSFVSAYYYFLHYTLLEKSLTLVVLGLALLAMRWLLLKYSTPKSVTATIGTLAKESENE
ncbi:DUF4401 domain-containing protein [Shewanella sp. Scap07]|uniref:DUF4401 domain-containing protein n=1 Tax=Shewanella sp. Scap07 TaxID=2589987 RepID=UPI0015BE9B17|nr:DUF4401 domain-containing protein [Shewanella sp. Scap07]